MLNREKLLKIETLSKKYNETNIPLYLSYPIESWWKKPIGQVDFERGFKDIEEPFLYFHFPYCKKPCYYCCCYKDVASDPHDLDIYLDHLEMEYNNKVDKLGTKSFQSIKQMHWGGGTPTFMECEQIERAYNFIDKRVGLIKDDSSSISIEAFPDKDVLSKEKLKLLREIGFNEISFGVQDFDKMVQNTINRSCEKEDVLELIDFCKSIGFKVHIDLCYGLPFQGLNEFERTLKTVIDAKPDRVAIFPYAHYPLIFPMQKLIPTSSIANSFTKVLLLNMAQDMLCSSDYGKIGTDHFVRKDNPLYISHLKKNVLRDFMGYSVSERKFFIGFGKAAISSTGREFFHNLKSMDKYFEAVSKGEIPIEKNISHIMDEDDFIRSSIIQKSILYDFEIDKFEIGQRLNIDFDRYFENEIIQLENYMLDGLIEYKSNDVIRVTSLGELFARHIAYVFDSYYNNTKTTKKIVEG